MSMCLPPRSSSSAGWSGTAINLGPVDCCRHAQVRGPDDARLQLSGKLLVGAGCQPRGAHHALRGHGAAPRAARPQARCAARLVARCGHVFYAQHVNVVLDLRTPNIYQGRLGTDIYIYDTLKASLVFILQAGGRTSRVVVCSAWAAVGRGKPLRLSKAIGITAVAALPALAVRSKTNSVSEPCLSHF